MRASFFHFARKTTVAIADDGEGVSDESKEKLFEMFYTTEKSSTDSRRGLGLGLALCKTIVAAQGGSIFVKDNHSKGTVICFNLPAKSDSLASPHLLEEFNLEAPK